jgi:hypothetical protein
MYITRELAALNAEIGMAIYERARADMMLDLRSKKPPATDAENVDTLSKSRDLASLRRPRRTVLWLVP